MKQVSLGVFVLNCHYSCSKMLRLNGSPGIYLVVKCGVSGHNIRSRPCLRSPPVGILVMGSKFAVVDEVSHQNKLLRNKYLNH